MTTIDDERDSDSDEAQQVLAEYTKAGRPPPASWERVYCCGSSRHLYCEVCFRLLVPTADLPEDLLRLELPFDVDILLDDKRSSSTGVQIASIDRAIRARVEIGEQAAEPLQLKHRAQVLDIDKDEVPSYDGEESEGTYVLFPGEGSVPISTLVSNDESDNKIITRLVVLDCKWASSARLRNLLARLPKVRLDDPPEKSYFWRWHNAGPGMVSTVEALYYAAWQITTPLGWPLERRQRLVHLLWLFRFQRAIIQSKYETGQNTGVNPHAPFTEEGKEYNRKIRRQQQKQQVVKN